MSGLSRRRLMLGTLTGLAACGGASGRSGEHQRRPERDPAPTTEATQPITALRILTYNVLADEVALEARMPALFRAMQRADADVIALQEVAPWFLRLLPLDENPGAKRHEGFHHRLLAAQDSDWLSAYHPATIDGVVAHPNGQSIFSRLPVLESRFVTLPGRQGRTVLISRLDLGAGEQLAIATTHMESFLEDGPVRARQLDAIFTALGRERDDPAVSATIFCGDLNFGDGEQPDSAHLDPDFVDLWQALRPGEPGYTWDIARSEMARQGSFVGEGSRRLDRISLRQGPAGERAPWRPAAIEIVGDQPVEPGDRRLFPSDHFGLVGEIRRGSVDQG